MRPLAVDVLLTADFRRIRLIQFCKLIPHAVQGKNRVHLAPGETSIKCTLKLIAGTVVVCLLLLDSNGGCPPNWFCFSQAEFLLDAT